MKSPTATGTRNPLATVFAFREGGRERCPVERRDNRGHPSAARRETAAWRAGRKPPDKGPGIRRLTSARQIQPTKFLQFMKRLPHPNQPVPPSGRVEITSGSFPSVAVPAIVAASCFAVAGTWAGQKTCSQRVRRSCNVDGPFAAPSLPATGGITIDGGRIRGHEKAFEAGPGRTPQQHRQRCRPAGSAHATPSHLPC